MRSRLKEMKMAAMANKTASSEEGEREEDDQTGAPTDGLVVSRRILEPSETGPSRVCAWPLGMLRLT